jgi:hypothetical protein
VAKTQTTRGHASHFTRSMQTEAQCTVNGPIHSTNKRGYAASAPCFQVARWLSVGKFAFRQGLWIEDLQTPPGQECSNGSMILFAVVLWRASCSVGRDQSLLAVARARR